MNYLDGIDRSHVHKLWLLKCEAKRNGRKSVTIISIANDLLAEALADSNMDELEARFCAKPSSFVQQPLLKEAAHG